MYSVASRLAAAISLALASFLLPGCLMGAHPATETQAPGETPVVIENYDSSRRPVERVFASPPRRVIAVWQNNIETILALGAGESLVAAIGIPYPECLRPELREAYARVPLRQMEMMSAEQMLLLEPDLIAAWYSTFSERVTKRSYFWQDRGIRTYITPSSMGRQEGNTIEGECDFIRDMGRIFRREANAEEIIRAMRAEIDFVAAHTKDRPPARTLIIEAMGNSFLNYGEKTLAADILRHVGGELIPLGRYIGAEEIVEADPDVLFLIVSEGRYRESAAIKKALVEDRALQDVSAIRTGRVYVLPLYIVYASATRTEDGIRAMAAGLYPDLYPVESGRRKEGSECVK